MQRIAAVAAFGMALRVLLPMPLAMNLAAASLVAGFCGAPHAGDGPAPALPASDCALCPACLLDIGAPPAPPRLVAPRQAGRAAWVEAARLPAPAATLRASARGPPG